MDTRHLEQPLAKRLFLGSVEEDGGRGCERRPIDSEAQRGLVVSRRHEEGFSSGDRQAERGRRVKVREEHEAVVAVALFGEVAEEVRAIWPLLEQPTLLGEPLLRSAEHRARQRIESAHVAGTGHGKPAHGQRSILARSWFVDVRPGQVVGGAAGEDLDVPVARHPLGNGAAVTLGATDQLRAEAMHHEPHPRCAAWRSRRRRPPRPGPLG